MQEKPVYITGHKNPDTDSITSAIAYANYKRELGVNAIAGKIGPVGSEAEYLLERFGFEEPTTLFTAKSTLKDIDIDKAQIKHKTITVKEAMDVVVTKNNMGIIVADKNHHLEGVVGVDDLTSLLSRGEKELVELMSNVKLNDLVKTLQGEIILDCKQFKTSGVIDFFPGFDSDISKGSIAITFNNPEIQRSCINKEVAVLVIVGEKWIDSLTLEKAKEKGTAVIHTSLSPLSVSRLVFQALSIEHVMVRKDKIITFKLSDNVDEVSQKMAKTRYRSYPVLDENDKVVGTISRYHLLNYQKKQFILVDHNEVKQTIDDIEDGEVIEIVDHHRLGGIETINPITITTMIVGATCTIIALKYFESNVKLSKSMAGLLLGGIIADTLNFKSPTTTDIDIKTAKKLEKLSGVSIEELAQGLVDSSGSILNKQTIDVIYGDFKEFAIGNFKVGLSQTPCKSEEEFMAIKSKVYDYIHKECESQKFDLMMVIFTNPNASGSFIIMAGKKAEVVKEGFKDLMNGDYAPNVISRKKQVLPKVIEILGK